MGFPMSKTLQTQYSELKKICPEHILLLGSAGFYHVFSKDAEEVSSVLGISVTRTENHVATASFPTHALDIYLPKLIRAGKRVAISDEQKQR